MAKRITLKKSGGKKRRTQRGGVWYNPLSWFSKKPEDATTGVQPPPPVAAPVAAPPPTVAAPVAADASVETRGAESTQPASNNNPFSVAAKGGKRKRKSRGRGRK